MNRHRLKTVSRAFAMIALLGGSLLFAEQITVEHRAIEVLKGKGSMYLPPLATVEPGASIQILDREGRWCKVQSGSIVGYVLQGALDGTSDASSYVSAGGSASMDATASTAAKGWDEANWSQSHGYSREGLRKLNAIRDRISANPNLWETFKSEGHVGAQ